jgi:hypothetical protein
MNWIRSGDDISSSGAQKILIYRLQDRVKVRKEKKNSHKARIKICLKGKKQSKNAFTLTN